MCFARRQGCVRGDPGTQPMKRLSKLMLALRALSTFFFGACGLPEHVAASSLISTPLRPICSVSIGVLDVIRRFEQNVPASSELRTKRFLARHRPLSAMYRFATANSVSTWAVFFGRPLNRTLRYPNTHFAIRNGCSTKARTCVSRFSRRSSLAGSLALAIFATRQRHLATNHDESPARGRTPRSGA
jgi:hypothetical protein